HQGMSLLTLANLLAERKIIDRFHSDRQVQAAELLLQERLPEKPKIIQHPALTREMRSYRPQASYPTARTIPAHPPIPEVCILSNGTYSTLLTESGGGYSRFGNAAVSRWREDPVLDNWGSFIYIRDVSQDRLWSPSFFPCRT